ncbi:hypothetical protein OX283_003025 [Flavobacterium sp. SUN052]|uniref:hypothetical protein n=1 Tax=Flavobacterium sp. SUN052 TaxID=3002441 RepID=UPI00237EE51D|nr:hypothetical protein [Flavobacterium sp. SUN052]MEC4003620.1 hypothetical protein [Flavobacterium sp. SUN052]
MNNIAEEFKQKYATVIIDMMEKATNAKAKMWGTAIIGFGDSVLKYESDRELDWFIVGFSPRKQNFAFYISGTVEKE